MRERQEGCSSWWWSYLRSDYEGERPREKKNYEAIRKVEQQRFGNLEHRLPLLNRSWLKLLLNEPKNSVWINYDCDDRKMVIVTMLAQLRDEKVSVISWIEIKGGLINLGKKHPRWQIWTLTQVLITSVYWLIGHKFTSYRDNTRRGLFGLHQLKTRVGESFRIYFGDHWWVYLCDNSQHIMRHASFALQECIKLLKFLSNLSSST